MNVLRIQVKELQDIISKKETQVSVISEEWSNAKEQGRLLVQLCLCFFCLIIYLDATNRYFTQTIDRPRKCFY